MKDQDPRGKTPEWNDLLKSENLRTRYGYVIPRTPGAIQSYVYTTVFRTLTDQDISARQQEILARHALRTDPQLIGFMDAMLKEHFSARSEGGFSEEEAEAINQGLKASLSVFVHDKSFIHNLGYWNGIKISESIEVRPIEGDSEHLLLTAPQAKIGQLAGFPRTLLSRKKEYRPEDSAYENPYLSVIEHAEALGIGKDVFTDDALNNALENQFRYALGGKNYDEHCDKLGYPLSPFSMARFERYRRNKALIHKLMFEQMSDQEKELVLATRVHYVVTYPTIENRGIIHITASFGNHELTFDPKSGNMLGDLSKSSKADISFQLSPEITANTTHDELLSLRTKFEILANRAGLYTRETSK